MTHGHASQEGEHASHLAHDPFDRRVAMSMVMIAALRAAGQHREGSQRNDDLSKDPEERKLDSVKEQAAKAVAAARNAIEPRRR
jgi:hypothetical protein